ncbi:hypothetical protein L2E82_01561 [Cichorium intybus]|uniref:Uncharacterized protein n=1 Tax=Cichorium intybus TaxID=13427 RepID=A0ACB9H0B7_CICIN|nr:hypothetical protein L2E82_01561 [Cichorium intybus]
MQGILVILMMMVNSLWSTGLKNLSSIKGFRFNFMLTGLTPAGSSDHRRNKIRNLLIKISAYLTVGKRLLVKKKRISRKKVVTNAKTVGVVVGEEEEEDLNGNLQSSSNVEKSGSKGNTLDSTHVEQEMIDKETTGNRHLKRKRGRPTNLPSQSPNGSLEGAINLFIFYLEL